MYIIGLLFFLTLKCLAAPVDPSILFAHEHQKDSKLAAIDVPSKSAFLKEWEDHANSESSQTVGHLLDLELIKNLNLRYAEIWDELIECSNSRDLETVRTHYVTGDYCPGDRSKTRHVASLLKLASHELQQFSDSTWVGGNVAETLAGLKNKELTVPASHPLFAQALIESLSLEILYSNYSDDDFLMYIVALHTHYGKKVELSESQKDPAIASAVKRLLLLDYLPESFGKAGLFPCAAQAPLSQLGSNLRFQTGVLSNERLQPFLKTLHEMCTSSDSNNDPLLATHSANYVALYRKLGIRTGDFKAVKPERHLRFALWI